MVFYWQGDENKCLQACVTMILLTHGINRSVDQIDNLTCYSPDRNSQFSNSVMGLSLFFRDVKLYSALEFDKFVVFGEDYLKSVYSEDWLIHQKQSSSENFFDEREAANKVFKLGLTVHKPFLLSEDIGAKIEFVDQLLLNNDLIVSVDTRMLWLFEQSSGHAIVIHGVSSDEYVINDPAFINGGNVSVSKEVIGSAIKTHIIAIPRGVK